MPEEKLVVSLQAETAKLKAGLGQGKSQVGAFGESTKKAIGKIGLAMAGAFAATKIISFVKTGITEFAKFDRTLTQITGKIERAGQGFDGMREQIDGYIRSAEAASRFSKFELGRSLDDLITKTGDYNVAVGLNEQAMDLAVAGNVSLKVASDALGLAYAGNTSGVSQLARIMGMSTEVAKDTDAVFKRLTETTNGMARSEVSLATNIDKMSNSMNDAAEVVGERVGPGLVWLGTTVLNAFTASVKFTMNVIDTWGTRFGALAVTAMNAFNLVRAGAAALGKFLRTAWKNPAAAFDTMTKELTKSWDTFAQSQVDLTTELIQQEADIWQGGADERNGIDLEAMRKAAAIKKKDLATTTTTEAAKTAVHGAAIDARTQREWQSWIELKAMQDEGALQAFFSYETMKQVAAAAAAGMATSFEAFFTTIADGTDDALTAMKNLGKGVFRAIVNAIGQALITTGTGYITAGAAAALSVVTRGMSGGLLAAGAGMVAGGAAIKAVATRLAEGGIILDPTLALLGEERKPEAVIPLDRAAEFGFGGGGAVDLRGSTWTLTFPGVSDASDVAAPAFRQSVQLQTARGLEATRNRRGGKL